MTWEESGAEHLERGHSALLVAQLDCCLSSCCGWTFEVAVQIVLEEAESRTILLRNFRIFVIKVSCFEQLFKDLLRSLEGKIISRHTNSKEIKSFYNGTVERFLAVNSFQLNQRVTLWFVIVVAVEVLYEGVVSATNKLDRIVDCGLKIVPAIIYRHRIVFSCIRVEV